MKVTVNGVEMKKEEISYPVLMQDVYGDLVVLFVNENSGTVLRAGSNLGFGEYYDSLLDATDKGEWKKFEGTITLEND